MKKHIDSNIEIYKHLKILGIDVSTLNKKTVNEKRQIIKKKYYQLALKYHPDKSAENSTKFIQIKNSYEYVINNLSVIKHEDYDDEYIEILMKGLYHMKNMFETVIDNCKTKVYNLNPTVDQLFNKEIFCFDTPMNERLYIPLWHSEIYFEDINTRFICKPKTPKNIYIDTNNDIVYVLKVSNYDINNDINIDIGKKSFSFFMDKKTYDNKKYVFQHCGIPLINIKNIFDVTYLSNIIVYFV